MAYDKLAHIPMLWIEQNIDRLSLVHGKINGLFWICWNSGEEWRFGVKPPEKNRGNQYVRPGEWRRPTLEDTIRRAAIFAGVHQREKSPLQKPSDEEIPF